MLIYHPTHLFYMITIQCNQRCTKCSHWKYKDQATRLPASKIISAVTGIPTARELCIVGGEPLLFKSEIYEILEGIAGRPVRTVIVTNGVPMDRTFIEKVADYDIHIVVSIDTMDQHFWQFVRGTNSYDKVLNHFEVAAEILRPDQLSIQSVRARETEPHLEAVAAYARQNGVYHSVQDYISEGFEGSWTAMESVGEGRQTTDVSSQQCFAADRNLSILQNGDVYTCFQQSWIPGCQKPLGNLHTQSIAEILSHPYAQLVSEQMRICNLPCKVLKCNTKNE